MADGHILVEDDDADGSSTDDLADDLDDGADEDPEPEVIELACFRVLDSVVDRVELACMDEGIGLMHNDSTAEPAMASPPLILPTEPPMVVAPQLTCTSSTKPTTAWLPLFLPSEPPTAPPPPGTALRLVWPTASPVALPPPLPPHVDTAEPPVAAPPVSSSSDAASQVAAPPPVELDWEALAQKVGQPAILLKPHEGLMNGGDPACATKPDVAVKPPPLHFSAEASGNDLLRECIKRSKGFLREYRRYLEEHAADWYCVRFPARLASYWDPDNGIENLRRDGHLTGRFCTGDCKYCAAGIPKWTADENVKMHAFALGFWDHPDYKEPIKQVLLHRKGNVIQLSDTMMETRSPRLGNSLHVVLDRFYDRYLGIASVSSMWTERMISKLEFQVGGLSCIKSDRVNLRMYKYNNLGTVSMKREDWKAILKDLRNENSAAKRAKAAGEIPDSKGYIALFQKDLNMVWVDAANPHSCRMYCCGCW